MVDIRTIQLMLGHADIKQTQRYLNNCQSAIENVARPAGLEPATLGLEGRCSIH
jgi:hypothetical protein